MASRGANTVLRMVSCYGGSARTKAHRWRREEHRSTSGTHRHTTAHDRHRRVVSKSCTPPPLRTVGIRAPSRHSCVNASVYSCYLGHLCTIRPESVRFAIGEYGHHRRRPGADRLHPWAWSTPSSGRSRRLRVPDLHQSKQGRTTRPTFTHTLGRVLPMCPASGAAVGCAGVGYGPHMGECDSALFNGQHLPWP